MQLEQNLRDKGFYKVFSDHRASIAQLKRAERALVRFCQDNGYDNALFFDILRALIAYWIQRVIATRLENHQFTHAPIDVDSIVSDILAILPEQWAAMVDVRTVASDVRCAYDREVAACPDTAQWGALFGKIRLYGGKFAAHFREPHLENRDVSWQLTPKRTLLVTDTPVSPSTHGHGDRGSGSRDDGSGGDDGDSDPDPAGADHNNGEAQRLVKQKKQANNYLITQYLPQKYIPGVRFTSDQRFLLVLALEREISSGASRLTRIQEHAAERLIHDTLSEFSASGRFAAKLAKSCHEPFDYIQHLFIVVALRFAHKIADNLSDDEYAACAYDTEKSVESLKARLIALINRYHIHTIAELEALSSGAGSTVASRLAKDNRTPYTRLKELTEKKCYGQFTRDERVQYSILKGEHTLASSFLYAASPKSDDEDFGVNSILEPKSEDENFDANDIPAAEEYCDDSKFSVMAEKIADNPTTLSAAYSVLREHPDLCVDLAKAILELSDEKRFPVLSYLRNDAAKRNMNARSARGILAEVEMLTTSQKNAKIAQNKEKINIFESYVEYVFTPKIFDDLHDDILTIDKIEPIPAIPRGHKQRAAAEKGDKSKITTHEGIIDAAEISAILDGPVAIEPAEAVATDEMVEPSAVDAPLVIDLFKEPAQIEIFPDMPIADKLKSRRNGTRHKEGQAAEGAQLGLFDDATPPRGQSPPTATGRRMGVA